MNRTISGALRLAGLLALTLGACNGRDESAPVDETNGEAPAAAQPGMGQMEDMQGMGGMQGAASMQRHAQELDEMTSRMRQHIQQMRQLPPEQQHERMGEHVGHVSRMLSLVNRQMREMDMGMGMSDEQMGRMMGMSGAEHRRMVEELQAIRDDVEQLQTASLPAVRQRMPGHLEQLERALRTLEQSAEHMRAVKTSQ